MSSSLRGWVEVTMSSSGRTEDSVTLTDCARCNANSRRGGRMVTGSSDSTGRIDSACIWSVWPQTSWR